MYLHILVLLDLYEICILFYFLYPLLFKKANRWNKEIFKQVK